MKLRSLLEQAYADAGVALPVKKDTRSWRGKKYRNRKKVSTNIRDSGQLNVASLALSKNTGDVEAKPIIKTLSPTIQVHKETAKEINTKSDKQTKPAKPKPKSVSRSYVSIQVDHDARVTWNSRSTENYDLLCWKNDGKSIELGRSNQEKHLFIGLDFGTSSLKAVIHDKEREYSYSARFRDLPGINGYLLPCRVYKTKRTYRLESGEQVYKDLKLSFLANPDAEEYQMHVVAFLALALQKIRAWFFEENGDIYNGQIIWYMTIGLPIEHNKGDFLKNIYKKIGIAAWIASTSKNITEQNIKRSQKRSDLICAGEEPDILEDIEVNIEPEMAAQIYGFVSSTAYDPNSSNIYLIVDVGAGTLDASVFAINRDKRNHNEADFWIYKTTIESNGVMCWHTERVNWLINQINNKAPNRKDLLRNLQKINLITDTFNPLPNSVSNYFSGVKVRTSKDKSIDNNFYKDVRLQVSQNTYSYVFRNKLLRAEQMRMPMFFCGGGSRLPFYNKLTKHMQSAVGCTWYGVSLLTLEQPKDLHAPGVARADYDRLSVAYGLSQMKSKNLIYDIPKLEEREPIDYSSKYVSKSDI